MKFPLGIALSCAIALAAAGADRARSQPTTPGRAEMSGLAGVVQPSRTVKIGAATDGLLAEVLIERGDLVEVGQLVASLDARVERANARLAKARTEAEASRASLAARLALAEDQLRRRVELLEEGIVPATEIEALRAEVRVAKLAVDEADEQARIAELEYQRSTAILEQSRITSPIGGVVVDRFLSAGESLSRSGQEIAVIAQLDPLLVELHVPLQLLPYVANGDVARVDLVGLEVEPRRATVTVVDRIVDTASNTFRVRLELPNPGLALPAGVRCEVSFVSEEETR